MVNMAVISRPKPNTVAPPNLLARKPPRGAKKYPYENEPNIKPFSFEFQSNSAFLQIYKKLLRVTIIRSNFLKIEIHNQLSRSNYKR